MNLINDIIGTTANLRNIKCIFVVVLQQKMLNIQLIVNENENKQIEPIKPSKQQKQLRKSTANWNDEYVEEMVETKNQINKKYQQTVKEKKSKRIAEENKSNVCYLTNRKVISIRETFANDKI